MIAAKWNFWLAFPEEHLMVPWMQEIFWEVFWLQALIPA